MVAVMGIFMLPCRRSVKLNVTLDCPRAEFVCVTMPWIVSPFNESGLTTCAATRSPFREPPALSGPFSCAVIVRS